MKLMTWNVNGIKTLLQYNPWNTLKTYEAILNELGADIVCFQETKITKKQVERSMAVLPSYDSFFSSYSRKPEKGYSGTCIFTRRSTTIPARAEEGLSGLLPLDRRPEPVQEELIEGALSPATIALNMQDVRVLDLEGRTTMLDLGLFVLINLYCPNETNEERLDFKLAFNAMLEARVLNLIKAGREVIAVGDMNICSKPIDHCDPVRRANESPYGGFEFHPARKWFNDFIGPKGSMVDLSRHFYPDRKGMFTHWETRISARETNYGTRIDYILATPGLLPWIKTCEICPSILGSDHCPVMAEFHEEITAEDGTVHKLWDHINAPGRSKDEGGLPPDPPKLAAKFYPEFGAEQRLLSNFFGKGAGAPKKPKSPSPAAALTSKAVNPRPIPSPKTSQEGSSGSGVSKAAPSASAPLPASMVSEGAKSVSASQPVITSHTAPSTSSSAPTMSPALGVPQSPSIDLTVAGSEDEECQDIEPVASSSKRATPVAANGLGTPAKLTKKKAKNGQQTLAGFFKAPAAPSKGELPKLSQKESAVRGKGKGKGKAKEEEVHDEVNSFQGQLGEVVELHDGTDPEEEADEEGGADSDLEKLKHKAQNGNRSPSVGAKKRKTTSSNQDDEDAIRQDVELSIASNGQASSAWSSIFTAKVPPLCTMHNEPCKQWTVNKSGQNKGRAFWLCNRPVGEGYERSGQKKEDVNPEFRCNYFKWESDIKRPAAVPSAKKKKLKSMTPGHG